jgi:hypothetical protein
VSGDAGAGNLNASLARHQPKGSGSGVSDRVFQKLGYRIVRESGHLIISNGERRLVIPRHDPINAITMGAIARDVGLTPQQFRELL